jgi:hypothetical protein
MRTAMAAAVVAGVISSAGAQNIVIDSISGNGSMAFWGAKVGSTATVEWAASLTDAGRTNWHGLTNVVVSADIMTNDVPMFFRVRGTPATNLPPGLVAYYPFDGDAKDASGNGKHGTVAGNYQFVANGIRGGALSIVGTDTEGYAGGGHVILPSLSAVVSNAFSLCIWAKDDNCPRAGESYFAFGAEGTAQYCARLELWSDDTIRFALRSLTKDVGVPSSYWPPIFYTTWKHLVLVKSPTTLRAYVNGQMIGEIVSTETVSFASYSAIGRHWWGGGGSSSARMTALLDNARVYNRALTSSEVRRLYDLHY